MSERPNRDGGGGCLLALALAVIALLLIEKLEELDERVTALEAVAPEPAE